MEKLKCIEILEAVQGKLISGFEDTYFTGISTDSRKIEEGDLFIPLVGERFDGHEFISQCLNSGASGCITSIDIPPVADKVIIRVEDTAKALRSIAADYRRKFNIPVVAVTGSVGKTSTKDMIASAIGDKLNVLKTAGNFNNEIGLPLTVFKMDGFHQVAILEMGMSGFGEISRLTEIASPSIAVITNIGLAHIEKLGSKQNILKAKMEILEGLPPYGLVVLNGDDPMLQGLKGLLPFHTVTYGMEEGADYQAFNIISSGEHGIHFEISIGNTDYKVHIPVPGVHNVYNALAAIAVGLELKIPMESLIRGISDFNPGKMRMNIVTHNDIKVINDAYNASPNSMEAALKVLREIGKDSRSIAVLGDMLEMGGWAEKAHKDIGKFAINIGIDYIITVGEQGRNIALGAKETGLAGDNIKSFDTNIEAGNYLLSFLKPGDVVLVKGSRGMKMEEIVHALAPENN